MVNGQYFRKYQKIVGRMVSVNGGKNHSFYWKKHNIAYFSPDILINVDKFFIYENCTMAN